MKELFDTIDKRFTEVLKEKDVWSASEISIVYQKVKNDVLIEYLSNFIGKK